MSHKNITIYYSIIALVLVVQTVATVVAGGSMVLHSAELAELKVEKQQLLAQKQIHITQLTQYSALSALPSDAVTGYTAIHKPLVITATQTVASTRP